MKRFLLILPFLAVIAMILYAARVQNVDGVKPPPPPPAEETVTTIIVTASPAATSTPAVILTGMDAINEAIAAGKCPDPDKIPDFIDVRDPVDSTGQKLCPKTAGGP